MPSNETWETIGAVFVSLGGATVLLAGLSGWLANLWAKRILANESYTRQKELEVLKSDLAEANETAKAALALAQSRKQAEFDHRVHVSKAQFDLEFKIYQDLWNRFEQLRVASVKFWVPLRAAVRSGTHAQIDIAATAAQRVAVEAQYQAFVEYYLSQSPFVAESVNAWLDRESDVLAAMNGLTNMAMDALHAGDARPFDQIAEAQLQINAKKQNFGAEIRKRLASVAIIG